MNRRESIKLKPKGPQINTLNINEIQHARMIQIRSHNHISNMFKSCKKYPKVFKQTEKKVPCIIPNRASNSPFILKGHNFSNEDILPPNFGLEDVFLKHELNQRNNPNSILIKNQEFNNAEITNKASNFIRYFHTADGVRQKKNNIYQSSSLDPYRDSPPYIQHNDLDDGVSIPKQCRSNADRSTINSETGPRIQHEEDSPFFIKRRIRSSNPHARVKRQPHPMISKHFFKKQMSRQGTRNKPPTSRESDIYISNLACKSESRNRFADNLYIEDSFQSLAFM